MIKLLVIIQLLLGVTYFALGFATRDANDFSGLIVIVPVYLAFVVGIIGFVAMMIRLHSVKTAKTPDRIKELAALVVFAYPVLLMAQYMAREPTGTIALFYVLTLGVYILLRSKIKIADILINIFLAVLPMVLIIHALTLNDPNLLITSLIVGGLLLLLPSWNLYTLLLNKSR